MQRRPALAQALPASNQTQLRASERRLASTSTMSAPASARCRDCSHRSPTAMSSLAT
jgi:hypothetical protein